MLWPSWSTDLFLRNRTIEQRNGLLVFEGVFVPVGTCWQDRARVGAECTASTCCVDGTGPGQAVSWEKQAGTAQCHFQQQQCSSCCSPALQALFSAAGHSVENQELQFGSLRSGKSWENQLLSNRFIIMGSECRKEHFLSTLTPCGVSLSFSGCFHPTYFDPAPWAFSQRLTIRNPSCSVICVMHRIKVPKGLM